jgi:hypothetical protein
MNVKIAMSVTVFALAILLTQALPGLGLLLMPASGLGIRAFFKGV